LVGNRRSHLEHEVSASRRPSHLLLGAHSAMKQPETVQNLGVLRSVAGHGAGNGMMSRVVLELAEGGGAVCVHEVSAGAETVGLSLDDAKRTLAALQRRLVQSQVADHCRQRRRCLHCGAQRSLKDRRQATDLAVWRGRSSRATARSLPVRRGVSPEHHSGGGDHA
jgi:hypothetical protein